jgi:hypothetical protein
VYIPTTFHIMSMVILQIPGRGRVLSHVLLELMLRFLRRSLRQHFVTVAINHDTSGLPCQVIRGIFTCPSNSHGRPIPSTGTIYFFPWFVSRVLPYLHAELSFGPVEALLDSGTIRCLISDAVYKERRQTCSLI